MASSRDFPPWRSALLGGLGGQTAWETHLNPGTLAVAARCRTAPHYDSAVTSPYRLTPRCNLTMGDPTSWLLVDAVTFPDHTYRKLLTGRSEVELLFDILFGVVWPLWVTQTKPNIVLTPGCPPRTRDIHPANTTLDRRSPSTPTILTRSTAHA